MPARPELALGRPLYIEWAKNEKKMIERKLTLPEILLIAGTRVVLGAGIGLLASRHLNNNQRKSIGWTLALIGGLTTIPIAMGVIGQKGEERIRRVA